ncbi:MAG: hypothetical protein ACOX3G_02400 [Armatimonadota bacterium]
MVKAEVEWAAAEQVQAVSVYALRVDIKSHTDAGNRVQRRPVPNVMHE